MQAGVVYLILLGAGMFGLIGFISILAHYYTLKGVHKMQTGVVYLILLGAGMFGLIGFISILAHYYTLNGIKSKTVGDGQHGTARFTTKNEIKSTYKHIPYDVADWCKGKNLPTPQGLIVGDLFRNYASIAKDYYGYNVSVIDLRNPTRSDGNNMLHLVNKYMDIYLADNSNIAAKAKAEKYASATRS